MDARTERQQQRGGGQILVAAAGYGKTTALRRWLPSARWYQRDTAVGTFIKDAVADGADQLVLDDLPVLSPDDARTLGEAVADHPDMTVILALRWPLDQRPPGPARWSELGPASLALSLEQVADVIAREYGLTAAGLAERVHDGTGGWPALVHLTAQALRLDGVPDGPLAPALTQPGGPLATYVAEELLAALPRDATRFLRQVGDLSPVSAALGQALGHPRARSVVALLRRTGFLTRVAVALPGGPPPQDRIVPVVAEAVRLAHRAATAATTATTAGTAAEWYEENGPPLAAAQAYRRAGRAEQCARVLAEHGDALIAGGHCEEVADLVQHLPPRHLTRTLTLLLGDALRTLGDLDAAARAYESVGTPAADPALAWRLGRIHYQRGDARTALATFEQATKDTHGVDRVLVLAWTAHAHLLAGDVDAAVRTARRAVAAAGPDGNGTAHLSLALGLAVAGDAAGSEEHFTLATKIAERAGDILLLTRIHTNRTYQLYRSARYADALDGARQCARYAAVARSASLRAIATANEADALAMLGRYDEAIARFEAALAQYQTKGSRRFAGALLGLGELYRRRGWREQARAAYEEAIAVTGETGNAHVLVPARAGLALVLLDDDPEAAAAHADAAADRAADELVLPALLAQGWVAVRSDPAAAADLATRAAALARAQRDRAGLADALELRAAAEADPVRVRDALREAQAIWTEAGAAVEAARLLVLLSHVPGAGGEERLQAALASEQLAAAGVHTAPAPACVVIRALGRLEVQVDGQTVTPSQWQSRKARDLLRILVARRGRPVPRDELGELLWPDEERVGHRLSVLLSIVRGVLDPAKAYPGDRFLLADQASIALDLTHVRVDVEDFLAQVSFGRRLVERGDVAQGRAVLIAADALYSAEVFEDEPYAAWAVGLREEARAAQLGLLRQLARTGRGDAVGYLLRLLAADPYDEAAHRHLVRTLVCAGQHGEARRAFTRYAEAMRAIGVPRPDRALLAPVRREGVRAAS